MPILAQALLRRCIDTMQDATSIRWTLRELVRYLNDAQREVVLYRPDAMVTTATVALTAGSARQSIPGTGTKLIEVIRNTAGTKGAVTLVNRQILDAQTPNWQNLANTANVIAHYMFDPRDPRVFYVYPPAGSASSVELLHSLLPTDIAQPAEGAAITPAMTESDSTQVAGNISVPDIYGNAVQDYVLYRALSKDSDYAGNAQRAQGYYASFANALGIEIKATVAVGPVSKGNPNV